MVVLPILHLPQWLMLNILPLIQKYSVFYFNQNPSGYMPTAISKLFRYSIRITDLESPSTRNHMLIKRSRKFPGHNIFSINKYVSLCCVWIKIHLGSCHQQKPAQISKAIQIQFSQVSSMQHTPSTEGEWIGFKAKTNTLEVIKTDYCLGKSFTAMYTLIHFFHLKLSTVTT